MTGQIGQIVAANPRSTMTAKTKTGVHAVNTPTVHQVPKSQPVRVEVRIGGRVRFSQDAYDPTFEVGEGKVSFTADLEPTWIDPPPAPPPTRFVDQNDPREGEEVIMKVHSGRRDIVEDEPSEEAEEEP